MQSQGKHGIQHSKQKIKKISLAKECYSMKLELLTNATVVEDAIRFVSQKSKEKRESTDSSNEDDKESREPDYDEDEDQLEEEREEEIRHNFRHSQIFISIINVICF